MTKPHFAGYFFCGLFIFLQCQSGSSGNSVINPNGDSELALLMREMFEECQVLGEQLETGKVKKVKIGLDELLTAEGTQPEKVNSPEFRTFAESYLQTVAYFNENETLDPQKGYTMVLNSCITCHEKMCPGPIKKIEQLYPE